MQRNLFENGDKRMDKDLLNEDQAHSLLHKVDIVRDPVHGDIYLTKLERFIVDTPDFQRLRQINQLGLTHLVYPGALHNRFIHSLGTLHVCSQMIDNCNIVADTYRGLAQPGEPIPLKIGSYPTFLARLCALLHDLAHVPFGHTFHVQAQVFKDDEWKDKDRVERTLGLKSEFTKRLRDWFFNHADLGLNRNDAGQLVDNLLCEILQVFKTDRASVNELPYPVVHDLVGNTICADLIDYVLRDMYFCGLTERVGDRFMKHLAAIPVKVIKPESKDEVPPVMQAITVENEETVFRHTKKRKELCRLVLLQYRYNEAHNAVMSNSVISEAIDLVRRRAAIAEKLYFHRTVMAAASMLGTAAYANNLLPMEIWDCSDQEVLKKLEHSTTSPQASNLGRKLLERKLFKPIFKAEFKPNETDMEDKLDKAYSLYRNPAKRAELIKQLERLIGLNISDKADAALGTVTMSCPKKDMNLKAFDMLVLQSPDVKKPKLLRLDDTKNKVRQDQIQAIKAAHEHLWTMEVYIDTEVVPLLHDLAQLLAGAIEEETGLENVLTNFKHAPAVNLTEETKKAAVKRVMSDNKIYDKDIKVGLQTELEAGFAARDEDPFTFEAWCKKKFREHGLLENDET